MLGLIFFLIVAGLVFWNIPANRVKRQKRKVIHPELMQFFRVPNLYITIFVGVMLYARGGFFLVFVGGRLTRRWTAHTEIKTQFRERKKLFTTKKGVSGVRSPSSSSSPSSFNPY